MNLREGLGGRVKWDRLILALALGLLLELSSFMFACQVVKRDEEIAEARGRAYALAWVQIASSLGNARYTLKFADMYLSFGGRMDKELVSYLVKAFQEDTYLKDVAFLAKGLGEEGEEAVRYLNLASSSTDPDVRRVANTYKSLLASEVGKEFVKEFIKEKLKGRVKDEYLDEMTKLVFSGLKLIGNLFLKKQVLKMTSDPQPLVRLTALYLLAAVFKYNDPKPFLDALGDGVASVRLMALASLYYLARGKIISLGKYRDSFSLVLRSDSEESVRMMALAVYLYSLRNPMRDELVRGIALGTTSPELVSMRKPLWRDRTENLAVLRWRAFTISLMYSLGKL